MAECRYVCLRVFAEGVDDCLESSGIIVQIVIGDKAQWGGGMGDGMVAVEA